MLLVARVLAGRPGARRATVGGVDRRGIDLLVVDDDGEHDGAGRVRRPGVRPDGAHRRLFELVRRARAVSGEAGQTTAERNMAELAAIRTSLTTVSSVVDVHPHLRRITFAGGDLATFAPIGPTRSAPCCCRRRARTRSPSIRRSRGSSTPSWGRASGRSAPTTRCGPGAPTWPSSTCCSCSTATAHGSSWAARARRGDPVALWGPRSGFHPPADVTWLLLAADETGLPGGGRHPRPAPARDPRRVCSPRSPTRDERQELPERPDTVVTWLHRDGRPAGTTTLLADAVAAATWPAGIPYVWGGGESHAMTAVRRHVRDVRGLDRAHVSLVAYWRRTGG